jgi:hypothetical protein
MTIRYTVRASAPPGRPGGRSTRLKGWVRGRVLARGGLALLAGLIALALGYAVNAGVTTTATAQAAELGELVLSSHPAGAAVWLDGVEQGTTPLVIRLATGRHRLEVAAANGEVRPVDAAVVAGRSVSHHVEFPMASSARDGILVVDTGDADAELSVDGTSAGATPLASTRVEAGEHAVVVRYRSGAVVARQVLVPAGETVALVLDPPARRAARVVGPATGWVHIDASFPVEVFERGHLVGHSTADRIALASGAHELQLVNASLDYRASVTTRVIAGKVAVVAVDTPRMPVAINARPWAQVMVDGRAHGDTPIANLMLPIGDHRVVLRHPELGEAVQMVTVRAGGPTRVSADLQR